MTGLLDLNMKKWPNLKPNIAQITKFEAKIVKFEADNNQNISI
jgi:hypothetical protein